MGVQSQVVGFARLTSLDEDLSMQLDALGNVDVLFEHGFPYVVGQFDKALHGALRAVRAGDIFRTESMFRVARTFGQLNQVIGTVLAHGASIEFVNERLQFGSGVRSDLDQRELLHAFASFESTVARELLAEWGEDPRKLGKQHGRTPRLSPEQLVQAKQKVEAGVPRAVIARRMKIDRKTLERALSGKGAYAVPGEHGSLHHSPDQD